MFCLRSNGDVIAWGNDLCGGDARFVQEKYLDWTRSTSEKYVRNYHRESVTTCFDTAIYSNLDLVLVCFGMVVGLWLFIFLFGAFVFGTALAEAQHIRLVVRLEVFAGSREGTILIYTNLYIQNQCSCQISDGGCTTSLPSLRRTKRLLLSKRMAQLWRGARLGTLAGQVHICPLKPGQSSKLMKKSLHLLESLDMEISSSLLTEDNSNKCSNLEGDGTDSLEANL